MYDAFDLRRFQRIGDLPGNGETFFNRNRAPLYPLGQGRAFDSSITR